MPAVWIYRISPETVMLRRWQQFAARDAKLILHCDPWFRPVRAGIPDYNAVTKLPGLYTKTMISSGNMTDCFNIVLARSLP